MRDLPGRGMPTLYGSDFAEVYSKYGYNQFSARVAELLPRVLRTLHLTPDRVLDVPCGEGTFALEMARKRLPDHGRGPILRVAPSGPTQSPRGPCENPFRRT